MALPTSGTITWEMIRAEFGGGYPIRIGDYYRGGPRVPNVAANNGVPTSGTISASQFYGATKVTPFTLSMFPAYMYESHKSNTTATLTATTQIQPSGGSGNYTVVSANITGGVGMTRNGYTCVLSSSGRNTTRTGRVTVVVSDGTTQLTAYADYEFVWGVPV